MIDLSLYRELQTAAKTKTILSASFRLDKETMLQALQSEAIFIDGKYYKVPERVLLDCLINRRYGEIALDLELIEK